MNPVDDRNVNPIKEMRRIAQAVLKLDERGYRESYISPQLNELIFDSEWCRINLIWETGHPLDGNKMLIYYGRLHAPNEEATMIWGGEACHCWHKLEYALHFLDGQTPMHTAEVSYSHPIKALFRKEEVSQQSNSYQPEWIAQMHKYIWHEYGNRLLELFDLRRPDLWEQYQQFLKEVYDIEGRSASIRPSLDKVC